MASKRRMRRNACGNKQKYTSHDQAYVAGKIITRKQKQKLANVGAYKCKFCGSYHWGHRG